jgi:hypothetical protein
MFRFVLAEGLFGRIRRVEKNPIHTLVSKSAKEVQSIQMMFCRNLWIGIISNLRWTVRTTEGIGPNALHLLPQERRNASHLEGILVRHLPDAFNLHRIDRDYWR